MESPDDGSPSLVDHDENSINSKTHVPSRIFPSYSTKPSSIIEGKVSRRTLDKRRKVFKTSIGNQQSGTNHVNQTYDQQQHSLRYESFVKRKRTLELTSQRLTYDKECLLLQRKNLDIRLAANECELERIAIEKRRIDLTIQKYQQDLPTVNHDINNHHQHFSDQEDHDDITSLDDMSDINE
jgi:hypothetical protein